MGARRFFRLAGLFAVSALMFHFVTIVDETEVEAAAEASRGRHSRWAATPRAALERARTRTASADIGRGQEAVPGEVMMAFGLTTSGATVREALAEHGLTLLEWSPRLGAARVGLPEGWTNVEAVARLASVAGLPRPELNVVARATGSELEDAADGEASTELGAQLPGYVGDPVLIALLDTGVDFDNPGISCALEAGADYVEDDDAPDDDNQHGTHLASIIDQITHGRAGILAVKVLDRDAVGTEFDIAQGIAFAVDEGARVINLSLSFGPAYAPSETMRAALDAARDDDVMLVAAAGNDGEGRVGHPAALPGVLAVGSSTADDVRASYSNFGAALDLLAPGGGEDAATEGIVGSTFQLHDPTRPMKVRMSGTSMATAFASAVAAVVRAEAPDLSAREVRAVLMASARRGGVLTFDSNRGAGVVDAGVAREQARRLDDDPGAAGALTPTTVAATHVTIGQAATPNGCGPRVSARRAAECLALADRARGVVLVEVLDDRLAPVVGATVWADIDGSVVGQDECTTDAYGRCVLTSDYVDDAVSRPAVFAARAAKVVLADGRISVPAPAQRLDGPRAEAVTDAIDALAETPIVVAEMAARDAGPGSLLGEYRLLHAYEWRPVVFGDGGSDIAVAFNDAFMDQLDDALPVYVVEDGLSLVSAGEGDPLTWVNDVGADVLAEGEGLFGSGQSPLGSFPLWSFDLMYDPLAGGAGLFGSGFVLDFGSAPWLYDALNTGGGFDAGGLGLFGSGYVPWSYVDYTFQTGFGLSIPASGQSTARAAQ